MNQARLKNAFQIAKENTGMDNRHILSAEKQSINRFGTMDVPGAGVLMIAVEELSELITELTLAESGYPDEFAILEETVDVELGMDYVRTLCGLSEYYGYANLYMDTEHESAICTLSIMQKQIIKYLRGKGNLCMMAKYVVRTLHILHQIEQKYCFTKQDTQAMKTVKIDRIKQRL